MTLIAYPDFTVLSKDGSRRLEVRSQENRADEDAGPGMLAFQTGFVYSLFDAVRGNLLWRRSQPEREPSPRAAYVSATGWAVVRTHGPVHAGLLVLSPAGEKTLAVDVLRDVFGDPSGDSGEVMHTTAGPFWTGGSFARFFEHGGRELFALRTRFGRVVLLDLAANVLRPDPSSVEPALGAALRAEVMSVLRRPCPVPLADLDATDLRNADTRAWFNATTAAALAAGQLEIADAVERLRELEPVAIGDSSTSAAPLNGRGYGGGWSIHTRSLRLVVQLSLRRLGRRCDELPSYLFTRHGEANEFMAPAARRAASAELKGVTKALKVLERLGSPDFVDSRWNAEAGFRIEVWEFDLWTGDGYETLRMEFSRKGRVQLLETLQPPPWISDTYRERRLLSF